MINRTLITLVAATAAFHGGAAYADSFTENEKRSYTKVTDRNLVGSCVDAIEDYYRKDDGLTLSRRGKFTREDDTRAYQIGGWIWRDGVRARVSHNCVANVDGKGLQIDISFPQEAVANRDTSGDDQS